jgi:WD40 repeat protein
MSAEGKARRGPSPRATARLIAALGVASGAGPALAQTAARAEPIDAASLRDLGPLMTVGRTIRGVLFSGNSRELWLRTSDGLVRVSSQGLDRPITGADVLLPDLAPSQGWVVVGAPSGSAHLGLGSLRAQLRFVDPLGPTPPPITLPLGVDRLHVGFDGRVLVTAHLTDARVFAAPPAASAPGAPWTERAHVTLPFVPDLTALSMDGRRLAASSGRRVSVFDTARGARVGASAPAPSWCPSTRESCPDHRGPTDTRWLALCVPPDGGPVHAVGGTRVAAVADAHRLDLFTGPAATRPLAELPGTLQRALFSPDCSRVAAIVLDAQGASSLSVYASRDGELIGQTMLPSADARLSWSPEGDLLAIATSYAAMIWDVARGETALAIPTGVLGGTLDAGGRPCGLDVVPSAARAWLQSAVVGPVRQAAQVRDGDDPTLTRSSLDGRVAVRLRGASITVIDLTNTSPNTDLPLPFRPGALAVAPDASVVALSRADGDVELRALPAGVVRQTIHAGARLMRLAWSSDGALLAGVDERGMARAWRVQTGASAGATDPLGAMVWLHGGGASGLFTLDDPTTSRVWSPSAGAPRPVPFGLWPAARSRRSVDGAVACGVVRAPSGASGVVVRVTDGEVLATAPGVGGCALSAGGDHVAWTTQGSPTARVQSLRGGGAASSAVTVGPGFVHVSALSPDGLLLATSDGSTVAVRDVRGGAAARVLAPSVRVDAMAFSPDGSLLVVMTRGAVEGSFQVAEVWAVPAAAAPGWTPSTTRT